MYWIMCRLIKINTLVEDVFLLFFILISWYIESKTEILDNIISNFDNIKPHQTLMVVYNSPNIWPLHQVMGTIRKDWYSMTVAIGN